MPWHAQTCTCYTCHLSHFITAVLITCGFYNTWRGVVTRPSFRAPKCLTLALFCGNNSLKCCRKLSSADVAIFGGINFGDRFGSWRDFAVRLEGDADVSELLSSLGWQMPNSLGTLPALYNFLGVVAATLLSQCVIMRSRSHVPMELAI